MKQLLALIFSAIVFLSAAAPAAALDVKEKNIAGTEDTAGLTDKQLAIQRWFAHLTYLNPGKDGWQDWYRDEKQLGLDSYRYSLAFLGYASGAMAYKTPAYTETSAKILDAAIQKMIEKRVWDYIERYWKKEPTFPDPVAWENIMYSGHLMQLISLYESITGDMKYSTKGWDFVWDKNTKIHYDAKKLMQAIYVQVEKDERGGVPCEPETIFIICNDHPHIAFALYDAIHGTHFTKLDDKWRSWMETNGLLPEVKGKDYLKISYLRDKKMWTTGFGVPGADGWALAWMYPWTKNTQFVCKGWRKMYDNKLWRDSKNGGKYIKSDAVGKVFGVNDASGTSFYPLVEKQCLRNTSAEPKAPGVFEYFEKTAGVSADSDGDGFKESYYYKTDEKTSVWTTANLAAAMVVSGDALRDMYRKPFFKQHAGEPKLLHADYPNVLVKSAEYDKKKKTLSFTIVRGSAKQNGSAELLCGNIGKVKSVLLNGKLFKGYKLDKGKLRITAPLKDSASFEVRM